MSEISDLLGMVAYPGTPEDRDFAWDRIMAEVGRLRDAILDARDETGLYNSIGLATAVERLRTIDAKLSAALEPRSEGAE